MNKTKKMTSMMGRIIWNYFSFNIISKKGIERSKGENIDIDEISEKELSSVGFNQKEISTIQEIYHTNRIAERIDEISDEQMLLSVISRFLYIDNPEMSQLEFIDTLHQYNIDYSDEEGQELYKRYLKFQKTNKILKKG